MPEENNDVLSLLVSVAEASPASDSPEIITTEDGKRLLVEYEAQVIAGWEKRKDGELQMRTALFAIVESGLWRYATDDDGNPFNRKEDYLSNLADHINMARSTIFAHQSTLRLAARGMGMGLKQIEDIGLGPVSIARRFAVVDRSTGEVLEIPGAEIPDGKTPGEFLHDVLVDVASGNLRPKDFRKEIKARLGVEEPEVTFFSDPNGDGFDIGVEYEFGKEYFRGVMWQCIADVPEPVREQMFKALHMMG